MHISKYLDAAQMYLDFVTDVEMRTKNNKLIAAYIDELETGTVKRSIQTEKARRVAYCGKSWFFDVYPKQGVRDFKTVFHCGHLFCPFCQRLKALTRQAKYMPEIEKLSEKYSLYHFTLTIPNMSAFLLKPSVDKLYKSFPKLLRYLTGNARIKGIDFSQYGFAGCVRTLEITFDYKKKSKRQEYHPHFHCIVAFDKELELLKTYRHSKFSYDFEGGKRIWVRDFSNFEILLQKIWYLIYNDQKVTKQAIDSCTDEQTYSCTLNLVHNGDYREVFKYTTKAYDENKEVIRSEQFETLQYTLQNRRTIQGYGCFRNIQPNDEIDMQTCHSVFDAIISYLRQIEEPAQMHRYLDELKHDMVNTDTIYLNRKMIFNLDNEKIQQLSSALEVDKVLPALQAIQKEQKQKRIPTYERSMSSDIEKISDLEYVQEELNHKWEYDISYKNLLGDDVFVRKVKLERIKEHEIDLPF